MSLLAPILAVLWSLTGQATATAAAASSAGQVNVLEGPSNFVYLPAVMRAIDPPPSSCPLVIRDLYGTQRDWNWLVQNYGPLVVHSAFAGTGWRVTGLTEDASGSVTEIVLLLHDGRPVPNVPVAFYWPDAPYDSGCGPANGLAPGMTPGRCLKISTGSSGDKVGKAEFGLYAYYQPPAIGPYGVWVYGSHTNSDVLLGLGMLKGTNHRHLNVTYTLCP